MADTPIPSSWGPGAPIKPILDIMAAQAREQNRRLEEQARVLIGCGYKPTELTTMCIVKPGSLDFTEPEVVPLSMTQEQPDD